MSTVLPPACDRAIAEAVVASVPSAPPAAKHERLVLATTVLAASLAVVDGTVVTVSLPAIGQNLHVGGSGLSWIVNGHPLPLSALLLIGGTAGDRYGCRRLSLCGIGLFALASLLCAAAPNLGWLVVGRVLQGVGAALLLPNSLAILSTTFTDEARVVTVRPTHIDRTHSC